MTHELNPDDSPSIRDAIKEYEDRTLLRATKATPLDVFAPQGILTTLGPVHAITYTGTLQGDTALYEHTFEGTAGPLLVVDETNAIHLVGGEYHVSDLGIEDGHGHGSRSNPWGFASMDMRKKHGRKTIYVDGEKTTVARLLDDQDPRDPDIHRSVTEALNRLDFAAKGAKRKDQWASVGWQIISLTTDPNAPDHSMDECEDAGCPLHGIAAMPWRWAEQENPAFSKAPLGEGGRFAACVAKVSRQPGVHDPEGLCASIGRKKYGAKKMAAMAKAGRRNPPKITAWQSFGPGPLESVGWRWKRAGMRSGKRAARGLASHPVIQYAGTFTVYGQFGETAANVSGVIDDERMYGKKATDFTGDQIFELVAEAVQSDLDEGGWEPDWWYEDEEGRRNPPANPSPADPDLVAFALDVLDEAESISFPMATLTRVYGQAWEWSISPTYSVPGTRYASNQSAYPIGKLGDALVAYSEYLGESPHGNPVSADEARRREHAATTAEERHHWRRKKGEAMRRGNPVVTNRISPNSPIENAGVLAMAMPGGGPYGLPQVNAGALAAAPDYPGDYDFPGVTNGSHGLLGPQIRRNVPGQPIANPVNPKKLGKWTRAPAHGIAYGINVSDAGGRGGWAQIFAYKPRSRDPVVAWNSRSNAGAYEQATGQKPPKGTKYIVRVLPPGSGWGDERWSAHKTLAPAKKRAEKELRIRAR